MLVEYTWISLSPSLLELEVSFPQLQVGQALSIHRMKLLIRHGEKIFAHSLGKQHFLAGGAVDKLVYQVTNILR